jgi:hypothetical protein
MILEERSGTRGSENFGKGKRERRRLEDYKTFRWNPTPDKPKQGGET